jgi:hypothetical protein
MSLRSKKKATPKVAFSITHYTIKKSSRTSIRMNLQP